jgi:hypothetical protein
MMKIPPRVPPKMNDANPRSKNVRIFRFILNSGIFRMPNVANVINERRISRMPTNKFVIAPRIPQIFRKGRNVTDTPRLRK